MSRLLLGVLGSVLTLWWVMRGVDLAQVRHTLLTVSPTWGVISIICAVGVALTKTVRWRALYKLNSRQPSFGAFFSALMIAQMANVLIPIRLGELIRIGLMRKTGQASATTLSTILIEKALDFIAAGFVAVSLLAFAAAPAWFQKPANGLILVGLILGLGLILCWSLRHWLEHTLSHLAGLGGFLSAGQQQRLLRAFRTMLEALGTLADRRTLVHILFWTVLVWLFSILTIAALFVAFELPLLLATVIIMTLAASFSNIAPSPGLVGIVPVMSVIILDYYRVSHSTALGFGLALNAVMVGPLIILGGGALWGRVGTLIELLASRKESIDHQNGSNV